MNFTQFVRDYLATHPNLGLTFHQAMKDERVKCAFHEEKLRRCNEGIRDPPQPPRQPKQRKSKKDGDVIVNVNCAGTQPQTAQGRVPGVGPRGGPGGMPPPPPPGGLGPPGNLLPPFPTQTQPPRRQEPQPQPQPRRDDEVHHLRTITPDEVYRRHIDQLPVIDLTNEVDQTIDDIENNLTRRIRTTDPIIPDPLPLPSWQPIQLNDNIQPQPQPQPPRPTPRPQPTFTSQPANIFSMQSTPPRQQPTFTSQPANIFSMQPAQPIDPYAQSRDARDLLEMYTIEPENPNYVTQGDIIAYDRITQGQRQELQNQLDRTTESLDAAIQRGNQFEQENTQVQEIQRLADEHEQRAIGLENRLVNATEQGMQMRRRVEELEEEVQNAVTPEQQEHARRDYENQINQIQQESQRVQEDFRRQLAESQQRLQQGVAESDAAIDGMRRRYNELAQSNNAQYQQRLRTLQQLQQQMQYEDEQGRQQLQQQIQAHEQKMQGELATAKAYSEVFARHAINLMETKNNIQNQLDLHQYTGDYTPPHVTADGRMNMGGFSNIQFFESPNRVRELPEQREMGTQMEPEPEPMQIDNEIYGRNPMRQENFVSNEVKRINQLRRPVVPYEDDQDNIRRRLDDDPPPTPPQQPRLFGLSPSPISGQPTFQPRQMDTGYEAPASRVDAPEQRPVVIDNLFNDIAGFVRRNIGRNPNINNDLGALYTDYLRNNTDGVYENMQQLHRQVNRRARQQPFKFENRNGQFTVSGAGLKKALKKKTKK